MTVLEEAAFIDTEVFNAAIAPVLGIEDSTLMGITTPTSDSGSYFNLMQNVTYRGRKLFKFVQVATSCEECRNKGRAMECTHNSGSLPRWRTGRRNEWLKAMIPESTYTAEGGGVTAFDGVAAFPIQHVHALRRRDLLNVPARANGVVFVAVDPAVGGASSKFSIMSAFVTSETTVVSRGCPSRTRSAARARGRRSWGWTDRTASARHASCRAASAAPAVQRVRGNTRAAAGGLAGS